MTTISSGLFRMTLATVGGGSSSRTWRAWTPRRPSATPNSTRWPGLSAVVPAGSAVECTKTSPPSSRVRKPNPLSASYHLTLPVGTDQTSRGRAGGESAGVLRLQAIGPAGLASAGALPGRKRAQPRAAPQSPDEVTRAQHAAYPDTHPDVVPGGMVEGGEEVARGRHRADQQDHERDQGRPGQGDPLVPGVPDPRPQRDEAPDQPERERQDQPAEAQ